jgi:hypothetical protein
VKRGLFNITMLITASLLITVFTVSATAKHDAAQKQGVAAQAAALLATSCPAINASNFEVDPIVPPPAGSKKNATPTAGANLVVDGASPCIDWLAGGSGSAIRAGAVVGNDKPSGSNDDSFGQGTSENDLVPTVVSGAIPPNKSDLTHFGVYQEGTGTQDNLAVFWSRAQNPSGTTDMDFEFNQNKCDPINTTGNVCSSNGVTPVRTDGDRLLLYDLASGGTVVTISTRTWASGAWGSATTLDPANALGSANYDAIASGGGGGLGSFDPLTFGEAVINLNALLGGTCGKFGSVYLKSRSSTSFTSEIKDFVSPVSVTISNCSAITTSATDSVIPNVITDKATLTSVTNPTGAVTFNVYTDSGCGTLAPNGGNIAGTALASDGAGGYFSTASYTPTTVGDFYWIASYAGDAGNVPAVGKCSDAGEHSVVSKASPTLSTGSAETVTVSTPPTPIHDTATLHGAVQTSGAVGGSISFDVYGPFTATDATADACTSANLAPSGGNIAGGALSGPAANGDVTSAGTYSPTAVGRYRWVASYHGDAKNNDVLNSAPVDTGVCQASGELDVVNPQPTTLTTSATTSVTLGAPVTDTATVHGATSDASGTVTFKLYGPFSGSGTDACTDPSGTPPSGGNLVFTSSAIAISGADASGNHAASVPSSGTGSFTPTQVGRYEWVASYSGDGKNSASGSACNDAGEVTIVNPKPSTISTAQAWYPNDTATIDHAGGTVTFSLYKGDSTCALAGSLVYAPSSAIPVVATGTGGTAPFQASTSNSSTSTPSYAVTAVSTGDKYYWKAVYSSGDPSFKDVTSSCKEATTLTSLDNGASVTSP